MPTTVSITNLTDLPPNNIIIGNASSGGSASSVITVFPTGSVLAGNVSITGSLLNSASRSIILPASSGQLALTSQLSSIPVTNLSSLPSGYVIMGDASSRGSASNIIQIASTGAQVNGKLVIAGQLASTLNTYSLPSISGTLALVSQIPSTMNITNINGIAPNYYVKSNVYGAGSGTSSLYESNYVLCSKLPMSISGTTTITSDLSVGGNLVLNGDISDGSLTFTLPDSSGQLALVSQLNTEIPASQISGLPVGGIIIGDTNGNGSTSSVITITDTSAIINNNLTVVGDLSAGTNAITIPTIDGQMALLSDIPSTMSVNSITNIPVGNVVVGNSSSQGTASSMLVLSSSGATLTGNMKMSGSLYKGTNSFMLPDIDGQLALTSQIPTTMNINQVINVPSGQIMIGSTGNVATNSSVITIDSTGPTINGNLNINGAIINSARVFTFPTQSGILALSSQIPTTFSASSLANIPYGSVVVGNASSVGSTTSVLSVTATGATVTGNLKVSGSLLSGTNSISMPASSGQMALVSQIPSTFNASSVVLTKGYFMEGNISGRGVASSYLYEDGTMHCNLPLTVSGTLSVSSGASIGGDLTIGGNLNKGSVVLTMPTSSGQIALVSQVSNTLSVGNLTNISSGSFVEGGATGSGKSSTVLYNDGTKIQVAQPLNVTGTIIGSTSAILGGDLTIGVNGSIKQNGYTFSLPTQSGVLALSSTSSTVPLGNITGVNEGTIVIGNASSNAATSSVITIAASGSKLSGNTEITGALVNNGNVITMPSSAGQIALVSQIQTGVIDVAGINNVNQGSIVIGSALSQGSASSVITVSASGPTINGNLSMTGNINNNGVVITLPSSSGQLVVASQIPSSMSVGSITGLSNGYLMVGNASSVGSANNTIAISATGATLTGNLNMTGSINNGTYGTLSLPTASGQIAIVSDIQTSSDVSHITGVSEGYLMVGNASSLGSANNTIMVGTNGATLTGNLLMTGSIVNGTNSYTLPASAGQLVISTQLPTSMSIGQITNVANGAIVIGNTSNIATTSTVLTIASTGPTITGDLNLSGVIVSGTSTITLPTSSGQIALTSQIPSTLTINNITGITPTYYVKGNTSGIGTSSAVLYDNGTNLISDLPIYSSEIQADDLHINNDILLDGNLKTGTAIINMPTRSGVMALMADISTSSAVSSITGIAQGNIVIGNSSSQGSASSVISVAGTGPTITGNLGMSGNLVNGSYTYSLPSISGTLAVVSQIPTSSAVSSITGIAQGNIVIGNSSSQGSASSVISVAGTGATLTGNLNMSGNIINGGYTITLPTASGQLVLSSQIPSTVAVGNITNLSQGYLITGNASSNGIASNIITISATGPTITGNIAMTGNITNGTTSISMPTASGQFALTSQIPTTTAVNTITGLPQGSIIIGSASGGGSTTNIISVAGSGPTVNGNLAISGNLVSGVNTYSLPTGSGTIALISNIPTLFPASQISNIPTGTIIIGSASSQGATSSVITVSTSGAVVNGNLEISGSLKSGANTYTLPASSGQLALASQIASTMAITNLTSLPQGNIIIGNSSSQGSASSVISIAGTGATLTGNLAMTGSIVNGTNSYTLPASSGQLALASQINSTISISNVSGATPNYFVIGSTSSCAVSTPLVNVATTSIGTNSSTEIDVNTYLSANNLKVTGDRFMSGSGAYTMWNRYGGLGQTYIVNNKGTGSGGIVLRDEITSTDNIDTVVSCPIWTSNYDCNFGGSLILDQSNTRNDTFNGAGRPSTANIQYKSGSSVYSYSLPTQSGQLALVSQISSGSTDVSGITGLNEGYLVVGNASSLGSANNVIAISGSTATLTGNLKITGSLYNGTNSISLPASSGQIALTSQIPSTMAVGNITGVNQGYLVVGNTSNVGSASSIITVSATGPTITGNMYMTGNIINNTATISFPNSSGVVALTSQVPTSFSISQITNVAKGAIVIGDASSIGTTSTIITINGTGPTITGNLAMTGNIANGTASISMPTTSGRIALTSQIPTSLAVSSITGLNEGYVMVGNASSVGSANNKIAISATGATLTGNLAMTGSIANGTASITMPTASGQFALTSQLPTTIAIGGITGITTNKYIKGDLNGFGTASSVLGDDGTTVYSTVPLNVNGAISASNLNLSSNINMTGSVVNGTASISLPTLSGQFALTSQIVSGLVAVGGITGLNEGYLVVGNASSLGSANNTIAVSGTGATLTGNLAMTGSIKNGTQSIIDINATGPSITGTMSVSSNISCGGNISVFNNKSLRSGYANKTLGARAVATWTSRTSSADNNWYSVCWSSELGLFCAVSITGTGNRVMTSPDGITWTSRSNPVDNNWIGVCWSPELGLFCATSQDGTGNRVMTSPDGITWTSRTSAADNQWWSVCWSPELGLFCAVSSSGGGNRVMTSPDGITWTTRTTPVDNIWKCICWSPELSLFCAVSITGSGNRVMTSPDGITWTSRSSAVDNTWIGVCWSPELGLFCAVSITGTGNRVMTSPDGITWTSRTSAVDNNWNSICWSPELGLFCAVASTGTGNGLMTSPDGITWTSRTSAVDNNWYGICWSPELGIFCTVAYSGTGNRVMTSKKVYNQRPSQIKSDINYLTNTTDATGTGSGALVISGGLGVAKTIYAQSMNLTGNISMSGNSTYTNGTGSMTLSQTTSTLSLLTSTVAIELTAGTNSIILKSTANELDPITDNSISLGNTSSKFLNSYVSGTNYHYDGAAGTNNIQIYQSGTSGIIKTTGTISIQPNNATTGALVINGSNVMPASNNSITLGGTSNYWSSLYAQTANLSGDVVLSGMVKISGVNQLRLGSNGTADIILDTTSSCLRPVGTDSVSLGTSVYPFNTLYTKGTYQCNNGTSALSIYQDSTTGMLYTNTSQFNIFISNDMTTGVMIDTTGFKPASNNAITLGGASNYWSNIYAQTLNLTGSASISGNISCGGNITTFNNKALRNSYANKTLGARAVATWTSRTSVVDNQWYAVCWSSELGLFCAVAQSGTGNRVMTSPDGITWTTRSSAADNMWWNICWSPELSLFCAISSSKVMTSPDGITWTSRTSAVDNMWFGLCWSPELGLFCSVSYDGTGNRVMTSPDGITWTSRTSAVDNQWFSVCWSSELSLFCAVSSSGTGNRVMTSPDGITWTSRTSAVDNNWRGVCWSPELGLFCAVSTTGSSNRVMTSPDGITWTSRTSAVNSSWISVCWSPELGLFCAVSDSSSYNGIMTSLDGITWTSRTNPVYVAWNGVCWSPELGLFCAVAYTGTGNRVMTSKKVYNQRPSQIPSDINYLTNTTDASSSNSGALVISGGLGVAKSINVAGTNNIIQNGFKDNSSLSYVYNGLEFVGYKCSSDGVITSQPTMTAVIDNGIFRSSMSPAQYDMYRTWQYLQAGTYTVQYYGLTDTDNGIVTIYVDDSTTGVTIDLYAASATGAYVSGSGNITISSNIRHTIDLRANTKNVSSSNYRVSLQMLVFTPV